MMILKVMKKRYQFLLIFSNVFQVCWLTRLKRLALRPIDGGRHVGDPVLLLIMSALMNDVSQHS